MYCKNESPMIQKVSKHNVIFKCICLYISRVLQKWLLKSESNVWLIGQQKRLG